MIHVITVPERHRRTGGQTI